MKNYQAPEVMVNKFDDEILTDIISTSAITENHEQIDAFDEGWLD